MVIDLLALLVILGGGVAVGVLLHVRHIAHRRAEWLAEQERLADQQELDAAWAKIHRHRRGGLGPSGVDPRDRTLT